MPRIAYVNGRYQDLDQDAIRIEDRGYQFADAVYEVVHIHQGRFVDEDLHLDRLERSLRELRIAMPMKRSALSVVLREVARRNRIRADGIVYLQVSRGVARRDHAFPTKAVEPVVVATAKRLPAYQTEIERWTGTAITQPDLRWGRCDIKTVGLLPNCLARQAAREAGATEAILVDGEGRVTEGASTNVWIVDQVGRLRTRQIDSHILAGCTRAALVRLIAEAGIAFEEGPIGLEELQGASEVFLTSASSFVKPMVAVDGRKVGDGVPGPVARRLHGLFTRHVTAGRNAPHGQASNAA